MKDRGQYFLDKLLAAPISGIGSLKKQRSPEEHERLIAAAKAKRERRRLRDMEIANRKAASEFPTSTLA